MNKKDNPCYNCEERTFECHADCSKYNKFREKVAKRSFDDKIYYGYVSDKSGRNVLKKQV